MRTPAKMLEKQVQLGSLSLSEFRMLRAALIYAATLCEERAETMADEGMSKRWSHDADQVRALCERFQKAGRR